MRQEHAFLYHARSVSVEVRFHDPFVLVYFEPPIGNERLDNGKLCHPPLLFVLVYSAEQEQMVSRRIDFDAAILLHPTAMERVRQDLQNLRVRSFPPSSEHCMEALSEPLVPTAKERVSMLEAQIRQSEKEQAVEVEAARVKRTRHGEDDYIDRDGRKIFNVAVETGPKHPSTVG